MSRRRRPKRTRTSRLYPQLVKRRTAPSARPSRHPTAALSPRQRQERRNLAHVELAVAVGIEDVILGRGRRVPEARAVTPGRLVGDDAERGTSARSAARRAGVASWAEPSSVMMIS